MKQNKINLNQNSDINSCSPLCTMVCRNTCDHNGFMEFDIFLFSNSYQERLPIIYANIRV